MLRRAVLLLLAVALTADAQFASPSAQPTAVAVPKALPDSLARWVDSIFAPYSSVRTPGCAVGVTDHGALVFTKGYGSADLEHETPITADTRFYIASLSKQFTAMSIVLLAQEHKLSLDDPIQKWVPEVPSFGVTITLNHLLHHTSGLRDYFTLLAVSGWPMDGLLTEAQFLNLVAHQKSLNFQPGEEFLYSNTGYALLSIVVRRASGQSLRDFAAARIFTPLGMTHTEFRDDHTELIPERALGYQPEGTSFRISQPQFDVVGDGGVYSTVGDLAKWDANFQSFAVGGASSIAMLQEPGRLNDSTTIPYALALSVGQYRGLNTFSHGGAYGGYRSTLLQFPEKKLSVITLCNTAAAAPALAEEVGGVFLGLVAERASLAASSLSTSLFAAGTDVTPADSIGPRRRADQVSRMAGSYYSDELELPVTLTARDGSLILQRPRAEDIRFAMVSDDLFTNSDKMLLRVLRDSQGVVTGFSLTVNRVRDLEFLRREAGPSNERRH
ncbi:MAG: serine hydrolase domain-containing protein [Gemmatimonadaceae bacterium]